MIKGIGKKIVVINDPGGKLYEQAIFILKQDTESCDKDMLSEAERIISQNIFSSAYVPPPRGLRTPWLTVLLISISVSLIIGISVLLFVLL